MTTRVVLEGDRAVAVESRHRGRLLQARARREVVLSGGAIGSPPAVINAICDALGVRDVPMPATPYTVWRAANGKL